MDVTEIVAELDAEIARLQHVKGLLLGEGSGTGNGRGAVKAKPAAKKRTMSAAGRAAIAAAQKARWAKQKKAAK